MQLRWIVCQAVFLLLLSFIYALRLIFSSPFFLTIALLPDFTIWTVLQRAANHEQKYFLFSLHLSCYILFIKNEIVWPLTSSSHLRFYAISSLNNLEVAKWILYRQINSMYFQILSCKLELFNALYRWLWVLD